MFLLLTVQLFDKTVGSYKGFIPYLLFIAIPLIEDYSSTGWLFADAAPYLPFTYLNSSPYIGYIGFFTTTGRAIQSATSTELGLAVLITCSLGACATAALFLAIKAKMDKSHLKAAIGHRAIALSHARIGYGKHTILDNVSFKLNLGDVAVLEAPNGSGKTTLLKALAGDARVIQSGIISVHHFQRTDSRQLLLSAFFAPSDDAILHGHLTPRQHLDMAKKLWRSKADVQNIIDRFHINSFSDKPTRKLSQGMCQQLTCAIACCTNASVTLLDEPTSHLDEHNLNLMVEQFVRMKEDGRCLILSLHQKGPIEKVADYYITIQNHTAILHAAK